MKKLFTLFAGMIIASAAWADDSDLYEPMIVESGFNRDVIAEATPYYSSSVSYFESSVTDPNYYYTRYNHATKEVIRLTNNDTISGLTDKQREQLATETGWPNDNGKPGDRKVECISTSYPGLFWELAPYDEANALCLRDKKSGCVNMGRFTFKNVGCYQKLYFLTFAGGASDSDANRMMTTTVYYSKGEPDVHTFEFQDCAAVKDNPDKIAYIAQIYNKGFVKGKGGDGYVYAAVSEMDVDTDRLIDSVHFSYSGKNNTGIAIFAVTGKTADIAAPASGSSMQTTDITKNSFSASWEPVEGADTYRIDVATDEDFHHMVKGYNNETVIHGTDTIIEGLGADSVYYWRVRAVTDEGGQSASSAPRRVRTESEDGPKETNEEDHSLKDNDITPLLNTTTNLIINRTLYKDGYLNTLCLPFNQSATEIAAGPLAECQLFEFESAEKKGDAQLDIRMTATDHIEAGKPYLIQWKNTGEILTKLEFKGVTIITDEGLTIGGSDEVQFVGNINTTGTIGMENGNKNHLFVGANNTLYWPNTDNGLKGFRAHFEVPVSGPASVPQNTPARIVTRHDTATAIDNTGLADQKGKKVLEGNKIVIVRNGLKYNVLGQLIK